MAIWPSSSVLTIKSNAQGREMIPLGTISPPPMAHTAGSTQFPANIAVPVVPAGGRTREPVPTGPLTSHWVVSSLAEPFCSETHADLHPTHLQPLQSRPMDSSAPRALPGGQGSWQCVFVTHRNTTAAISPPPFQACATQRKVGAAGVPSRHPILQRP